MFLFFFFNDTATTEIYTLSLHDALPILSALPRRHQTPRLGVRQRRHHDEQEQSDVRAVVRELSLEHPRVQSPRSEEHTSELQSPVHLVCRLLLEKKKKKIKKKNKHNKNT